MEYLTSAVSSVNMQAVLVANGLGLGLMIVLMLSTNRRGKMVSLDGRLFRAYLKTQHSCIISTKSK